MLLSIALMLAFIHPASAADADTGFSGLDLYNFCSANTPEGTALCLAYVGGLSDGLFMGRTLADQGIRACLPENDAINRKQAALIVQKYLADHPEKLAQKAPLLVMDALANAFPCSKRP